ncbi:two-component sensor histidine kinase [Actinoplanes cyaneus]|uniref:histidine kinase n=1 Tax=Actinoplanes cyaneus TaxID=52696 RepID=A0A919IBV2_9ACTN|nr:HAMP domain-containing sensor histidine kinase [Actinoplanes cyaneus]MCW2136009.1 two-component system, OmpR family, sensor kinase [Actinoplanes cyaneus]GID62624.1 two-component sensor histidine kinase [Actinoplanes cyaneus]
MRFRGSLRVRLLVVALGLLTVGILISDVLVLRELRVHLVDRVDRQVSAFGQLMARLNPQLLSRSDAERGDQLLGGLDLIDDLAVTYLDESGRVAGAAEAGRSGSTPPPAAALRDRSGAPVFGATGQDGSAWRLAVLPRAGGGVVVVGASLAAVDDILTRLLVFCALTEAALVVVLGAAGWFGVPAALRPLRAIERTAAAIAAGDLQRRVPVRGPPGSEVARLTAVLNDMLAQIERAFGARAASEARMRRFVADVGHELRTPLFGIAGSAELHLMRESSSPGEIDRTMRRIDTEARRLTRLVEDLLLLARLDEPAAGPVLDREPMDLRTLAADARDQLEALEPGRAVTLTGVGGAGPPGAAPVLGDEARLRQVVVNLVGNVHAHTPADGPVRIGVGCAGGRAILEIADSGPGVPEAERERIFERFHRGESSRARSGAGGSGLGLSIVRSLVVAHGGDAEVRDAAGGGALFRVSLPAHSEHAQGVCGNGQDDRAPSVHAGDPGADQEVRRDRRG